MPFVALVGRRKSGPDPAEALRRLAGGDLAALPRDRLAAPGLPFDRARAGCQRHGPRRPGRALSRRTATSARPA